MIWIDNKIEWSYKFTIIVLTGVCEEKELMEPSEFIEKSTLSDPFDWKLSGPEKSLPPDMEFPWYSLSDVTDVTDCVGEFVLLPDLCAFGGTCLKSALLSKGILPAELP